MLLEDKGKPNKFHKVNINFDVLVDNERKTLGKLSDELGFFNFIPMGNISEVEVIYDTSTKLLTGAGLVLRKRVLPERTYFSLVRINPFANDDNREKKNFLGDCEPNDQPSDFPVQIAEVINEAFKNVFAIDLVDVVKHCTPYISIQVTGHRYRVVSGTGAVMQMNFENLQARDMRTGKKVNVRNCLLSYELDPAYEKERKQLLDAIDHKCKELVPLKRNRFEIAQAALDSLERKSGKRTGPKKSKKQVEEELSEKAVKGYATEENGQPGASGK